MANDFRRIVRIAQLGDLKMALVYDDATVVVADFTAIAAKGGVFARLLDPAYFKKARIAEEGHALAWPQGLDFCADALYGPRRRTKNPRRTPYGVQIFPEAGALVKA